MLVFGKNGVGQKHVCPELIAESVYGLPEIKNQREKIAKAKIVANPMLSNFISLISLMPLLNLN